MKTSNNLYNTGFLSSYTLNEFRINQGLDPQNIANICDYSRKNQNTPNGKCNNFLLYPIQNTELNYGLRPISNKAVCTRYVQAP